MKVKKKVIGSLEKCYSLAMLHYKGKDHFLAAAEKVNSCFLYDLEGNYEETVWEGPGGVMTMVQVPGSDGQFLATQKFYSPNDSREASLAAVTPRSPAIPESPAELKKAAASGRVWENSEWEIRTLLQLPFVHRFDIIRENNINYLIACTLKSGHEYKNDWSHPGRVYAGILPDNLCTDRLSYHEEGRPSLTVLMDGMYKNHGYCRYEKDGKKGAVISCEQGVYFFEVPETAGGQWRTTKLIGEAASDALLIDLNRDGEDELVTLSPFHGDTLRIYEKRQGEYICAYTFPKPLPFLHALWGGTLYGRPAVIIGHREGERQLLMLGYDRRNGYTYDILDRGCGAANVLHYTRRGKEIIVAANRETDEIAMYELDEKDE